MVATIVPPHEMKQVKKPNVLGGISDDHIH